MPLQVSDGEFICDCYPPPFPMFSHGSLFKLNCYSVHDAAHLPSADKVNKSPLLPSHAHESRGEGGDGEFSSPFYFPYHHSKLFIAASFFNEIDILAAMPATTSQ